MDGLLLTEPTQTWKKNSMNSVEFNFSQNLWNFRQNLELRIRNNFKNVIFIPCKWGKKICKFYLNSSVISCSTCQKEEKECLWVKYLFYVFFCRNCKFSCNFHIFSANSVFPKFQSLQKKCFFPSLSLFRLVKGKLQSIKWYPRQPKSLNKCESWLRYSILLMLPKGCGEYSS